MNISTAHSRTPRPEKTEGRPHEYKWHKDETQANEGLDTMIQSEVAAILYGIRDLPEAIWDRLEAERETAHAEAQLMISKMVSSACCQGRATGRIIAGAT